MSDIEIESRTGKEPKPRTRIEIENGAGVETECRIGMKNIKIYSLEGILARGFTFISFQHIPPVTFNGAPNAQCNYSVPPTTSTRPASHKVQEMYTSPSSRAQGNE
ncbi:hypothetical protein EVAR_76043_1 [Eumeta japonica]|uniref:Uncharacterized protein n=1 Tax=Eumeta variegata TaxID=151549 RepID=A0A4C1UB50_EUMVA|nr:hypothetical protein EVAR_76043_1 [Eumeta japonica]